MKKTISIVALLALVAFVATAMAQPKPGPASPATTVAPAPGPGAAPGPAPEKAKPEKPKAAAKMQKFSGTVEKVDEMAKSFVVKDKKGEKTFMIGDKTKIMKGGKEMPLAEMKQGMHASVNYKMEMDKMMADMKNKCPMMKHDKKGEEAGEMGEMMEEPGDDMPMPPKEVTGK